MIQFLADILQQAVAHRRQDGDFVGHVGGDDFVIITNHSNAYDMCMQIIHQFDRGIVSFYDEQKMSDVLSDITEKACCIKDRYGNEVLTNGIPVSIAMLECSGEKADRLTLEKITRRLGELKKTAKASIGSVDSPSNSVIGNIIEEF